MTLAINFGFNVLVARALGASAAGVFFTAMVVTTFIGMVGRFGTDIYALKHAAVLTDEDLQHVGPFSLGWLTKICVGGSSALAVLTFGAASLGLNLWSPASDLAGALVLLALSIPFQCYAILNSAVLRATHRAAQGAFAEMGMTQGLASLGTIGLGLFHVRSLTALATVYVISSVFTAGASWIMVRRSLISRTARGVLTGSLKRGAAAEMGHMMMSGVLSLSLGWLPIFALWIVSSSAQVAFFTAAARMASTLNLMPFILMTGAIPTIAHAAKRQDISLVNETLSSVNRRAALLAMPVAGIMVLGSTTIMQIYGTEFAEDPSTLRVLVLSQLSLVLLGFVSSIMNVVGQEHASVILTAATLVVGIPVVVWASWMGGSLGAAYAMAGLTLGYTVACVGSLKRRTGIISYVTWSRHPQMSAGSGEP